MDQKIVFQNLLKILDFTFNLDYNESLNYLLYSCKNPMFGKKKFGEWHMRKTALTNQIVRFLNQVYFYHKVIK